MTLVSRVAVLLCTYNGARHLNRQLESIASQDIGTINVFASDDNSVDGTLEKLSYWADNSAFASLQVRTGPGRGHAANFLSLISADDIDCDIFAFADQDDIWDTNKLSRAVAALDDVPSHIPALYCTRTRTVSETGELNGLSPLFSKPPAFPNALLQNIAGGNTMVMNAAARALLQRAGAVDVVSHDWWTYLLVSGGGGEVIYDARPSLSYRQHERNAIGANTGFFNRFRRYGGFLSGRNRVWNERNIKALQGCRSLLTENNQRVLAEFENARKGSIISRFRALRCSGVYAQTTSGNIGLIAATLLKKI